MFYDLVYVLDIKRWLEDAGCFARDIAGISAPHQFLIVKNPDSRTGATVTSSLWSNTRPSPPVEVLTKFPEEVPYTAAQRPVFYRSADETGRLAARMWEDCQKQIKAMARENRWEDAVTAAWVAELRTLEKESKWPAEVYDGLWATNKEEAYDLATSFGAETAEQQGESETVKIVLGRVD